MIHPLRRKSKLPEYKVQIDMSEIQGNPDATIAKAQAIRRAASAPAHPSSQDRLVAAAATRMEAKARMEKMKEAEAEEGSGTFLGNIDQTMEQSRGDERSNSVSQSGNILPNPAAPAYNLSGPEKGKLLNKVV